MKMRLHLFSVFGAAVLTASPALAEGGEVASENPNAVVWDADAQPPQSRSIALKLGDAYAAGAAPLRMPATSDGAGVWWGGESWRNQASLNVCADIGRCEENISGGLTEHVDLRLRSDGETVRLGALVRFGEQLSAPRANGERGWQFFAAADAHALTWSPGNRNGEAVRVREQQLLGDAQAGISREFAGGDLAFGFVHREVSYKGASRDEQFGGVTFVLSR